MLKARYLMVGGFLGAGKTTAILQAARYFQAQKLQVGLITNDQSHGLADTALLGSHGFPTAEIGGGCFCCRFNSLVEASRQLDAEARPDIFLAEPVGSCTDLVATVSFPLRQMYGDAYAIAPLTVLVDPIRSQRILGLRSGKTFSPKVLYIYQKQLEEADVIVINKQDLLDKAQLDELEQALRDAYPQARLLTMSARTGDGLSAWLTEVAEDLPARKAMEVDYDTYADGERLLGWVNITASIEGRPFDGNRLLLDVVRQIEQQLQQQTPDGVPIAHLKATLTPDQGNDVGVANAVGSDLPAELSHQLVEPLERGEMIVNLRAEGEPEVLEQSALDAVRRAAQHFGLVVTVQHQEAFRPGRPTPTHRFAE
jgi:G3E family GTPase